MNSYIVTYTLANGKVHVIPVDAMNERSACRYAFSCCPEARLDVSLYGSVSEVIRKVKESK